MIYQRPDYRPDIDGLRAVAVVSIILFHANFPFFSGGYIGVDVFFVISGYLITSIILSDLSGKQFSFWVFFVRRARRILPALTFVTLVSCWAAWEILSPIQMKEFGKSVISVATFSSNLFFLGRDNYFAASAEVTPMLHMWSLAVEEQFYILFPAVFTAIWVFRRNRLVLSIALLALVSFAACVVGSFLFPKFNFYFFLTRGWEFLAGSLVACLPLSRLTQPSIRSVLAMLGLAMVAIPVILWGSDVRYPGIETAIPVVGAALVIAFGRDNPVVFGMLSSPAFRVVGLMSYSLYLWHQPLFAFARIGGYDETVPGGFLTLIVVLVLLSLLTWRMIEIPVRHTGLASMRLTLAAFLLVCLVPLFSAGQLFAHNKKLVLSKFSPEELRVLQPRRNDSRQQKERCFLISQSDPETYAQSKCLTAEGGERPSVLLVGDSHAAGLYPALARGMSGKNANFGQMTAAYCIPLILEFENNLRVNQTKRCEAINRSIRERIETGDIDVLIISSAFDVYFSQIGGGWTYSDYPEDLYASIQYLSSRVKHVIVVGPFVLWKKSLPEQIFREMQRNEAHKGTLERSKAGVQKTVFTTDKVMQSRLDFPNLNYVSVVDAICDDKGCLRMVEGRDGLAPIAFDYGHLSEAGGRYVVDKLLLPQLESLLMNLRTGTS